MSVGRFFLFSFSQNLNRSTSAHFYITLKGFAMAVFIRKEFSKPLLQNQCYMLFLLTN